MPRYRTDVRESVRDYLRNHGPCPVGRALADLQSRLHMKRSAVNMIMDRMEDIERPFYGMVSLIDQAVEPLQRYPEYVSPLLEHAIETGSISQKEARKLMDVDHQTANNRLLYLKQKGLLSKEPGYNKPFTPTKNAKEIMKNKNGQS